MNETSYFEDSLKHYLPLTVEFIVAEGGSLTLDVICVVVGRGNSGPLCL